MGSLTKYRGHAIAGLASAAIALLGVTALRWPHPEPIVVTAPTTAPTAVTSSEVVTPVAIVAIQVHVTGAVVRPGVYTLDAGSRLVQAVELAGGMAPDADEERINLADYLVDGQQVYVPRRGTPIPPSPTPAAPPGGAGAARSGGVELGVTGLVNINTASAAELEALPGIGPALAGRIIAYREANGPFADPSDIVAVSGIGEATYRAIADRITVR